VINFYDSKAIETYDPFLGKSVSATIVLFVLGFGGLVLRLGLVLVLELPNFSMRGFENMLRLFLKRALKAKIEF